MNLNLDNPSEIPILYTFRRCPYAMRARLAIEAAGVHVEYREIQLRDKPQAMLEISPKGTVPVLKINNDTIIEESIDIIFWALDQNHSHQLLSGVDREQLNQLIATNDLRFKKCLDLYKYASRFPEKTEIEYRESGYFFLEALNQMLQENHFLMTEHLSVADIAIFPFIRQYAMVDKPWFDSMDYPYLKSWLDKNLKSELFKNIMIKRAVWSA